MRHRKNVGSKHKDLTVIKNQHLEIALMVGIATLGFNILQSIGSQNGQETRPLMLENDPTCGLVTGGKEHTTPISLDLFPPHKRSSTVTSLYSDAALCSTQTYSDGLGGEALLGVMGAMMTCSVPFCRAQSGQCCLLVGSGRGPVCPRSC